MASVKFSKESSEFAMFRDLWTLCQKLWIPENGNDDYWEMVIKDTDEFANKYNDIPLARKFMLAFVEKLEIESKTKSQNK